MPGRTLKVTKGRLNLMTETTFVVEWHRGDAYLSSGPKYVVRKVDRGAVLTAYVEVTNAGLTAVKIRVR